MINVLIIGSGGRECAIARSLYDGECTRHMLYCGQNQNNPIMDKYAEWIGNVSFTDISTVIPLLTGRKVDIAIIGPEEALKNKYVDVLTNILHIKCVGPTSKLSMIESSKIFARELLKGIGMGHYSPKYWVFRPGDITFHNLLNSTTNIVIKADGLHSGKGVKVFGEHLFNIKDCVEFCEEIHARNESFIIEEKLVGNEFSFMSFCDGKDISHTIPIKDFKRLYDGDKGPNTGSMGSITEYGNTLSFLTNKDLMTCRIVNTTVYNAVQDNFGEPYKGVLYGSFMKTVNGDIKVIEFNARFGDPECINLFELLETSLFDVFMAIVNQGLSKIQIKFSPDASVFKYAVPIGYPDIPSNGEIIRILSNDTKNLIGAGIYQDNGVYKSSGSRILGYILKGKDLGKIASMCDSNLGTISGPIFFRKDIGNTKIVKSNLYKQSGVNIEEGNMAVKKIQSAVESTFNKNVVSKFGDFSGLFRLSGYKKPILVSTTDGVGTKSIIVLEKYGREVGLQMLGRDIVNHCVNDMLVKGAKPLFFLDYFASHKINSDDVKFFVQGIADTCKEVGCVLIGGETAEMPTVYNHGHIDIVGTMIGVVEEDNIIDGKRDILPGDIAIGLPSSGPHTNGYSLIRKIVKDIEEKNGPIDQHIIDMICASHKSYLSIYESIVSNNVKIKGMVHVTGGGFEDNVPRVLPEGMKLSYSKFEFSPVFKYIQENGNVSDDEMKKVFNCGIGMVLFMDKANYNTFLTLNSGIEHVELGYTV